MSISDKTRKILWGRSGNLCALCKTRLVIDVAEANSGSVVGEECHIVSGAVGGPRYDPALRFNVDTVENLILLCSIHHKLVDDQPDVFQPDALRNLKSDHEAWVRNRLAGEQEQGSPRVVREAENIPSHLVRIASAKALLDLALGCDARYDSYPEDLSGDELDYVGALLQNLTDWIDIGLDQPSDRIAAQKSLAEELSTLEKMGLRIYGGREKQTLVGGPQAPSLFFAMHLSIVRDDDPRQVQVG